jgi:ribosomal protein S18 acetylase RimI-like enzyme
MEQITKINQFSDELIKLLSPAVYMPTYDKIKNIISSYLSSDTKSLFAFSYSSDLVGIIGMEHNNTSITITHIAVEEAYRHRRIGSNLIKYISSAYKCTLELETDNDAVEFYRSIGFQIENLGETHPGFVRYKCTLEWK